MKEDGSQSYSDEVEGKTSWRKYLLPEDSSEKMNKKVGGGTLVIEDNPRRGIKQTNKVVYAENHKQLTFNTA